MLFRFTLLGVLLPAVAGSAIAVGLTRWPRMRRSGGAAAVAVGGGYVAGHLGLTGWHGVAPLDVQHWLPHGAVLAAGLGLYGYRSGTPQRGESLVPLAAAPVVAGLLLWPRAEQLGTWGLLAAAGVAALALAAYGLAWARCLQGQPVLLVTAALGAAAATGAVAVVASGSILVGQLCGVVAAATAGAGTAAWVTRSGARVDAMPAVAGMVLGGCGVLGTVYSSLPGAVVGLLLAIPFVAWGIRASARTRFRAGAVSFAQLLAVVVLGAAAALWAAAPAGSGGGGGKDGSEYDYGYG